MEKTRTWLMRYGRPLEAARWEFLFEEGSKERVIRHLEAFQNEDGGFGHGLEPDFWLPGSSSTATVTAGQILLEIGASPGDGIVQRLVSYLTDTPQIQPGIWATVLPENNLYPHAPWWHWEEGVQKSWMFNPSVELAAMLIHWSAEGSPGADLGWESLGHAVARLLEAGEMDRHEVQSYRRSLTLLSSRRAQFEDRTGYSLSEAEAKVDTLVLAAIDRDAASWGDGYKTLPMEFIQSPADPLYPELKDLVLQNLRFYLDQRNAEGVWNISWSWGQYPAEFAVASRYWQGILAVERYKILKSFKGECHDQSMASLWAE